MPADDDRLAPVGRIGENLSDEFFEVIVLDVVVDGYADRGRERFDGFN